jgi:hypothetical protein
MFPNQVTLARQYTRELNEQFGQNRHVSFTPRRRSEAGAIRKNMAGLADRLRMPRRPAGKTRQLADGERLRILGVPNRAPASEGG